MATQIILVILIVALIVYSIFLQIQLTKKNIFIESTVKRLSGIEKTLSTEEMMSFLSEIQRLSRYGSHLSDKLLGKETLDFIFENSREMKIFMHYTRFRADAENILSKGFNFADSFYKTALPVSNDRLDMKMKHSSRKYFGDFLIIICISNDIVNYYSREMEKAGIKNHTFENILTEAPPVLNENSELVYQLSSRFVKGFLNHRTGEIVKNNGFDPWYNSPAFGKNIDRLKTRLKTF